jgi:hypothetical protein
LSDGEVDFLACAGPVDAPEVLCVGGTPMRQEGRIPRGGMSSRCPSLTNGEVVAIPVYATRSLVKRPKIFDSHPPTGGFTL